MAGDGGLNVPKGECSGAAAAPALPEGERRRRRGAARPTAACRWLWLLLRQKQIRTLG